MDETDFHAFVHIATLIESWFYTPTITLVFVLTNKQTLPIDRLASAIFVKISLLHETNRTSAANIVNVVCVLSLLIKLDSLPPKCNLEITRAMYKNDTTLLYKRTTCLYGEIGLQTNAKYDESVFKA